MNEKEKDALIQVKHFNNITRYWQEEEYEEKEIKKIYNNNIKSNRKTR